jgi:hypothetical protein
MNRAARCQASACAGARGSGGRLAVGTRWTVAVDWGIIILAMDRRAFVICALVVLALELLALGQARMPGPATAEIERIVAGQLQDRHRPVGDVRCVRRAYDEATCVATMYPGLRTRVAVTVDSETGRVASTSMP